MARPTTKADLLSAANEQYGKLEKLIDSMGVEEQNTPFQWDAEFLEKKKEAHWQRDKNLRDVLIHLYEWHQLLLDWVAANQKGEAKPFIPEPYNWKTYGNMNIDFWEKHQTTSLEEAKALLKESHEKVVALIEGFTNDELFAKKYFSWTGTSSLGSYCISATSSHYDWALKKVRQHIKVLKK